MAYLLSSYHPGSVAASLAVATLASYVALDLTRRVRHHDRGVARAWWLGGSLAMGTGIWCMHFVGMLAFSLPIAIGFSRWLTALSWVAAVGASAIALFLASGGSLNWRRLAIGSASMGAGICAMHYIGMASMQVAPGIVWDAALVAMSAFVATAASAASLIIFFWLRGVSTRRSAMLQLLAAGLMGAAICGMHYTGMAAASFPAGSVCAAAGEIRSEGLGGMIAACAVGLLVVALASSALGARSMRRAAAVR